MSCNNVQILNFNHNIVEVGSDNKLIITDNVRCNSITIPQPVTNILQINSPGPQGPQGPVGNVNVGAFVTTSSFNAYTGSSTSQFAGTSSFAETASYITLQQVLDSGNVANLESGSAGFYLHDLENGSMYISPSAIVMFENGSGLLTKPQMVWQAGGIFYVDVDNTASNLYFPKGGLNGYPVIRLNGQYADVSGSLTIAFATTGSNNFIGNQNISGSVIVTGSLTVSGSSTFTNIGPAIFSGSVNVTQGITGSLFGTSSFAETASYAMNAGTTIDTGSFATTGSNTFTGTQTITGSNGRLIYTGTTPGIYPTLAEVHINNDYPWLHRFYNDTFSTSSAVMAYFGWNDGRFVFHNESTQSIGLQVNGYSAENGLLVYSDKVAFVNNVEVTGSLNVTQGITSSIINTQNIDVTSYGNGTIIYITESINNNIQLGDYGLILQVLSGSDVNLFSLYPTASISTVSITAPSFTGSLSGTASWTAQAVTSSRPFSTTGSTIYTTSPSTIPPTHLGAILIGSLAGGGATAANYSIMMGDQAGYQAELSNNANFIGQQAGYQSTSSAYSNFIGPLAGFQAYSSPNSNFIGIRAGYLSTAPYSTYIGAYTGYLLQGSNNIILGTGISLPNGTNNAINLGGVIYATNTAFNTSVISPTIDPVGGKVGINVLSPSYNFQVSGSVGFTNLTTASVALTNVLMISSSGQLFITASSAIGGGTTVNTGSLLVTASASSNIITFIKGDASTFTITVDTGSSGGVSGGTNNYIPLWSGSTALTSSIASQQTGSGIIFNTPSVNINDLFYWEGYVAVYGSYLDIKNDLGINIVSQTTSSLVFDGDLENTLGLPYPWVWTNITIRDSSYYNYVTINDPYYNNISSIVFYSQSFDSFTGYYTTFYSSSTSPGTVFPNTIYSSVTNILPKIYVNGDLQVSGSMIGTASYSNYSNYATLAADATSVAVKFSGNTLRSTNASNVSPYYNIFLGEYAGFAGSSAYSNFIGHNAGYMSSVSTTSSYSNFIGYYAGYFAEKASYSTLIGYKVGFNASVSPYDGIGSNNIIIGTHITLPANTKDSINLGGIIFATGSYSSLINYPYSGSVNGRVGINVVSPIYSFQVSGSVGFTNLTTSSAALTNVLMVSSSGQLFVTASSAIGGGSSTTKAGSGSAASFGGSPLTSSITFTTPFTNNLYAVTVIGEDARPWTIQDKVSGSFVINSNSSVALSGPIYWVATPFNNS